MRKRRIWLMWNALRHRKSFKASVSQAVRFPPIVEVFGFVDKDGHLLSLASEITLDVILTVLKKRKLTWALPSFS